MLLETKLSYQAAYDNFTTVEQLLLYVNFG